jgi:hypothetical protein
MRLSACHGKLEGETVPCPRGLQLGYDFCRKPTDLTKLELGKSVSRSFTKAWLVNPCCKASDTLAETVAALPSNGDIHRQLSSLEHIKKPFPQVTHRLPCKGTLHL